MEDKLMYKHKLVQALADLVSEHQGDIVKGLGAFAEQNMIMKAFWAGFKNQAPAILGNQITKTLQALDDNEEAVEQLRQKLLEVLEVKPEPTEPVPTQFEEFEDKVEDTAEPMKESKPRKRSKKKR